MSRAAWWLVACLASSSLAADGQSWRVVTQTPQQTVAIDSASIKREGDRVWFRERRIIHGQLVDGNSLRPVREILSRRIADCRTAKLATLTRAVFSDDDALIDHLAQQLRQAQWTEAAAEPAVYALLCGRGG